MSNRHRQFASTEIEERTGPPTGGLPRLSGRGARLTVATVLASVTALLLAATASADFGFLHTWGNTGSGNGQFKAPIGIDTDASGNVYVADLGNARVQKFGPVGGFAGKVGSFGTGNSQFRRPTGLAVAPPGRVLVAEEGPTLANDGEWVRAFTLSLAFSDRWQDSFWKQPTDLDADAAGAIYVVDPQYGFLIKYTASGGLLWERPGACNTALKIECDDLFDAPIGVAVDRARGLVYVADLNNDRVVVFNASGTLVRKWGSGGSALPERLNGPRGVATDAAGNVYVMDTGNARLKKFTATGTFLNQWGDGGTGPGQFNFATQLAVAPNEDVYISDTSNDRIQVFGQRQRVNFRPSAGGFRAVGQGVAVRRLIMKRIRPRGQVRMKVKCKGGSRRGCTFRSRRVRVRRGKAKIHHLFPRPLKPRAKIIVHGKGKGRNFIDYGLIYRIVGRPDVKKREFCVAPFTTRKLPCNQIG